MTTLKRLRGMEDLSHLLNQKHHLIVEAARQVSQLFCFNEIATPILESTEIFSRSLGADSDIVHKEMFTFKDRNGESITLRPEGTAGVVRHFITENRYQHLPLRFFYHGPMFRYERPQKGRLRQFHTIGIELLGEELPRGDIECISLAVLFLKKLNLLQEVKLEINSIGDKESRKAYQTALVQYLQPLKKQLSEDSQKRLKTNPLRILDSKAESDQTIIKSAPRMSDFLNKRSQQFFQAVTQNLDSLEIPWELNHFLVRGLDYYNHCVFEFKSNSIELGSQNTVLAGGRYDHLVETLSGGGNRVPGVGWATGIERLSLLLKSPLKTPTVIALVPLGEQSENKSIQLTWLLRKEGLCVFHPRPIGNLSKKMKRASQAKAKYAIIFGPEEIKNKQFSVKNMETGEQKTVAEENLLSFLKKPNEANH